MTPTVSFYECHSCLFGIGDRNPTLLFLGMSSVNDVVRPPALDSVLEGANPRTILLEDVASMDTNQVGIIRSRSTYVINWATCTLPPGAE